MYELLRHSDKDLDQLSINDDQLTHNTLKQGNLMYVGQTRQYRTQQHT